LFGVISPSGRLPETIPIAPDTDCPAANYFPGTQEKVEYREGLDVGYRYYDTERIPFRFPFGHGLHYTTFEYSNLEVTIERDEKSFKRVKVYLEVKKAEHRHRHHCLHPFRSHPWRLFSCTSNRSSPPSTGPSTSSRAFPRSRCPRCYGECCQRSIGVIVDIDVLSLVDSVVVVVDESVARRIFIQRQLIICPEKVRYD